MDSRQSSQIKGISNLMRFTVTFELWLFFFSPTYSTSWWGPWCSRSRLPCPRQNMPPGLRWWSWSRWCRWWRSRGHLLEYQERWLPWRSQCPAQDEPPWCREWGLWKNKNVQTEKKNELPFFPLQINETLGTHQLKIITSYVRGEWLVLVASKH